METTIMPATVLSAAAIAARPELPLGPPGTGVTHRVLWQDGTSTAGVLTVPAGTRLGTHTHRTNHHHIWLLAGNATILGDRLGPGSYVHIPGGVAHDIDATRTAGCTVFYLYIRPGSGAA